MILMTLLFLYDNRMGNVVINDTNGNRIISGTASYISENVSAELLASEVAAFGFYDGELTIKI